VQGTKSAVNIIKLLTPMPRYEFMYILASSVSDDQIPTVSAQIEQFVTDFGGTEVTHTQLGKKKLAYPIKKTRNGQYGVINFEMATSKVAAFDAKLRTQANTIIRYIIVNLEDHLARLDKDRDAQTKMNRNRPAAAIAADAQNLLGAEQSPTAQSSEPSVKKTAPADQPKKVEAPSNLDEEIEKAINEDISK
jgi:small subunit ribosomal protein S6